MKRLPLRITQAGFTLVELLVTMTLLGFLTVLLFGGLQFGARVWEHSSEATVDDNVIRASQTRLSDALTLAYPQHISCGSGCQTLAFDGEAQTMTFLSMADASDGDMQRFQISTPVQSDGFILQIESRGELSVADQAHVQTVLSRIEALEFSYYGQTVGQRTPQWHATWRQQSQLPDLVRIRIRMADHRLSWPDLLIAPKITAWAGCAIDLLTHDCQG